MAINAYIKLVPQSLKQTITIDEVKKFFSSYQDITSKTGEQLDWDYKEIAFPYEIKETEEGKDKWFYLTATLERYNVILIGVDKEKYQDENGDEKELTYIQVTLPEQSTFGDKGRANEYCKFLAKQVQGELHLFNGRVMYFYPRK